MQPVLAGYRVVDLTQNVAGPYCTQILADLGADVVKIERPAGGDDSRGWAAPSPGASTHHFASLNRRKRSVCIDLSQTAGCALVAELAAGADVFVHSMKPGSAEKRGLGEEALAARNPRLVYCAISAWGASGPLASLPGYDPIVQAFIGLMDITGSPGDAPSRVPVSVIDLSTGMWAALGILGQCLQRSRSGQGGGVQASLLASGVAWMAPFLTEYTRTGSVPRPSGTRLGNAAPYELFEAADGHVFLAAPNDRLFAQTCQVLGCPSLVTEPRFARNAERLRHRDELHALLQARTRERPAAELLGRLRAAGVPCGEKNRLDQMLSHPQVASGGLLAHTEAPDGESITVAELPLRLHDHGDRLRAGAAAPRGDADLPPPVSRLPGLGQHTDEVLQAAGIDDERRRQLRAQGVIR